MGEFTWNQCEPGFPLKEAGQPLLILNNSRTPMGTTRHELCKKSVRNKSCWKLKIQRAWIEGGRFNFGMIFRWWTQLGRYKVLHVGWRGCKLCDQAKLFHQVQDIISDRMLTVFRKYAISKFHSEDSCSLQFPPQIGMFFLWKWNQYGKKYRSVAYRIHCVTVIRPLQEWHLTRKE